MKDLKPVKHWFLTAKKIPFPNLPREYLLTIKQGEMETLSSSGVRLWTENYTTSDQKLVELNDQKCDKLMKNCDKHDGNGITNDARRLLFSEPCEAQKDLSDNELLFIPPAKWRRREPRRKKSLSHRTRNRS